MTIRKAIIATAACWAGIAAASTGELYGRNDVIDRYEVHDAQVQSVCKQLSSFSGVDIIVSEKITGTVSIAVSKKTWKEILAIVCRINDLYASNEGSYIYVLPAEEQRKRITDDASSYQASQEFSPLKREVIKINHTAAGEIEKSIQNLLSARGKLTVVTHTNALIVYDTEENIDQIRAMISQLDIETAQISISCKIIEVSSGVVQRMGVHWGYRNIQQGLQAEHMPTPSNPGDLAAGALDRITYGVLDRQNLTAALDYLFEENEGEIVAQPQITTIDNKEARIFMGQQIPVKYLDEAGNTVVEMINAGTELIVKPHISGEGRILLELSPKKESYSQQGDGTPIINQQSASTNVVVNNGETVVIAGLTSNELITTESGIPVLKDLPLIGNLFKRSTKDRDKKDLVIFVTPNILSGDFASAASGAPGELPEKK